MINVLHLVAGNLNGGAARGAYWLHQALLEKGVSSSVLIDGGASQDDPRVESAAPGRRGKLAQVARRAFDQVPMFPYKGRPATLFSTGFAGHRFDRTAAYRNADVIHLHWVNAGFVSTHSLGRVRKPMVWTLRDMWPLTGGCHYTMGCDKYQDKCGKCPQLDSTRSGDLSRVILNQKIRSYPRHMKIVGISEWISACAQSSAVFRSHDVRTIPNGIDLTNFRPINQSWSRSILGIDTKKFVILVGAQRVDDYYKGFGLFLDSLKHLDREKYHLCTFGDLRDRSLGTSGFTHQEFGFVNDYASLRLLYSAADVFVAPSVMDAFGKTLVEAMSCGVPTVCFDATGPRDIVEHKISGYKAEAFNPADLAMGMDWIITNNRNGEIGRAAQTRAQLFDSRRIAAAYLSLYEEAVTLHR